MVQFIELTEEGTANRLIVNIDAIAMVAQNYDDDKVGFDGCSIALKNKKSLFVNEHLPEIKELIKEAQQEHPYRTK